MNTTLTSTLRVYDEQDGARPLVDTTDRTEIGRILGDANISFERWEASAPLSAESGQDEILAAYAGDIRRLKDEFGYTTADVIRVTPETPNVPALRAEVLERAHAQRGRGPVLRRGKRFVLPSHRRQGLPGDLHAR